MATRLKSPHLFNAGANPLNVINNLSGLLSPAQLQILRDEIRSNLVRLYRLGDSHFKFATNVAAPEWRQRISRLYYGAYNARRALVLEVDGSFSTDSSDHKNVGNMPDALSNVATYRVRLANLREDRNLADYNHLAVEADLISTPADYQTMVQGFLTDAKSFLMNRGVQL
jgi:hypothetical protein